MYAFLDGQSVTDLLVIAGCLVTLFIMITGIIARDLAA